MPMSEVGWQMVEHAGADHRTERLRVPGGWLYRHILRHDPGRDSYETMSITFVPERPAQ